MSTYTIEVNDEAITKQVQDILNAILDREIKNKYSNTGNIVSTAVREMVYSRKDEIIEMVVIRAVREISKKSLPKLVEKIGDQCK